MRTTHKFNLTRARVLITLSAVVVMAGLVFAFAPMSSVAAARQGMAARLSANPTFTNIISMAPESVLKAFGLKNSKAATAVAAAAMNNNETITISAFPPSGSTVEPGGIIAYNINVTNGPAANIPDAFTDFNAVITVNIPAGTVFQSVNVGGNNGPTLFTCSPPAFNTPGPASFNCTSPIFVPNGNINVTLVVRVTNPYVVGGPINNSATYQDNDNDGAPFAPKVSNTVTHNVGTAAGPPADLQLFKLANKNSVLAGDPGAAGEITYTLQVKNNGPNTAYGVAVFDEVPASTTLGSFPTWSGTVPGTCLFHVPSEKFYCRPTATDAALPAGASATVTYSVRAPANVAAGSVVHNSALITSIDFIDIFDLITTPGLNTSPDPTPTNNYSSTNTRVDACADLTVKVNPSPDPVIAGNELTIISKVTNNGPSDAQNVVVRIPTHPQPNFPFNTFLSLDTTLAPGFVCTTPSVGGFGTISCTTATLPAGGMAEIAVKLIVRADYTGNVTYGRAIVTSSTRDCDPDNNNDTVTIDVLQKTDVEVVSKIANPSPAVAGDLLTYDIVVRNNGPSDAQDVNFLDPIPAGTSFVSVSATGVFNGRCNDFVRCVPPGGVFPAGATSTVRIVVRIDAGRMAPIVNRAEITTSTMETNTTNNDKQITTNVTKVTDLSIKKTGPFTVTAGNQYTYTVVVRNNGPSDAAANSVTVSDTLDSRLIYQSAFTSGAGDFSCSNVANAVTCKNDADMEAKGFATITFVFKVKDDVQANTIIPNTATVSAQTDPNNGNNTSTTSTAGGTSADLQLAKTATAGPVTAGSGTITYTIAITNSGPSDANGVKVNDNIPANTTLSSGPTWTGPPGGSCSTNAGTITCQPSAAGGVFKVGESAVITYTVSVPASALFGTLVTNQAVIASTGANATPDPNPSNNTQDPTSTLITTSANLSVDKTDSGAGLGPDPVVAGQNVTYRIRVNNPGPSDAQNVNVTDQLDPNTTFVSVNLTSASGFTCVTPAVGASGTLSCSRGVVPANPGANYDILLTVRVRPGTTGQVTNLSTVGSSTSDPDLTNNTADEATDVVAQADVELVSKTDSPDPVVAGQELTYRITFKNNGPSEASGVVISDTVPANTTFLAVSTPVGYTCTTPAVGATGVVNCSPPGGTLGFNEIGEIFLKVKVVTNPSSLTLSNTATITTTTTDPTPGNNSKTELTNVVRQTDLSIKKTGPATVTAGNTFTYTIVVRNDGPSDAPINTVTVSDTLDANLTPTAATADGFFTCSIAANTVTCNNNALFTTGGKATITITFTVNQGVPQNTIISNTAVVSSVNDPNPGNNTSTTSTAGQTSADLQLTKTAAPNAVVAGDPASEITYTINVLNSGPSVANGVVVSDTVPANTIVTSQPVFTNTGAPVISMACSAAAAGAQFTCVLNPVAPMPVGAAGRITYRVRVAADIAVNTVITNGATIASTGATATPDPNPSNNTQDPTSTLVNTSANLSITKTDSPDPVVAGANLTYTLLVANAGPSDAQNVVVTDALPAGLTYISAGSTDPGFVCLNSNNTVTCATATLSAGASATITIIARVNPNVPNGTVLQNSATVASTTSDPQSSNNNTGVITTTVNTNAVFTIAKSDNPDPVIAGTNLSYRVTLTNTGPSDAQTVKLTDTLPAGVDFVSLSASGVFSAAGACVHSAGVITCTATPGGVMPAGKTANLDIIVKVKSSVPAGTILTNTAVVTSPTSTQTALARTATTTTTVRHQSDLSLTKDAPEQAIAGTRIDYKLVITNGGPSDVLGGINPGTVTVVDTLPPGVTPVSLSGPPNLIISGPGGFTCSFAAGKVTCVNAAGTPGNVPVGSVITIIFKVNTPSNVPDGTNLFNCAEITRPIVTDDPTAADETDPNGGNNSSCDSTVFRTSADLGIGKTAAPVNPVPGSNPPAVKAGENIRYTVTFGNAGPSDAVNVKVTDNVPGNTSMETVFPLTVLATGGVYIGANAVKVVCSYNAPTNAISCIPTGNTGLTPSVPNGVLPAGVQGILTYDVKVNPSVTGGTIIANAANITSAPDGSTPGTPDPNTGNNTSLSTSTPVVAASQLGVTKTVKSATFASAPPAAAGAVVPGTFLTYEVTLRNNGPSDVSNVRWIDTLPFTNPDSVGRATGVKYISVTQTAGFGSTFTCAPPTGVNPQNNPNGNGGSFQCTAPTMAVTTAATEPKFEVVVFIDPATKASLVNRADINATTNNFNQPVSATATLTTPVGPTSDLAVTKTHTPDPVVAGTELEYTVTLTNNGPSTAQMATLVDTLPAFQALKSIQITQNPDINGAPAFTCTPDADAGTDPRATTSKITCTAAELPPNKKQDGTVNPAGTVVFKFRVLQSALTPQPFPVVPSIAVQNCVTATSMSFDPTAANSTNVCDTVNVIFRADLSITKTDTPDPVIAGNLLTYTINATNGGPSAALNMVISDPLPTGTVFISALAPGSTTLTTPAVNANGTVRATWAGLTAPGVTRTLTIVVRVCPEVLCNTILSNTATTTSDTPDPNPANNSATATTTVQAQSDLAISKSGPAFAIHSTSANKSVVTYTLNFSNKGPSNAAGTKIVDVLPKGFRVDTNGLSSTVPGTTFDVIEAAGITTVTVNLGVIGAANQCATSFPTSGTVTIRAVVPIKHPTITVTNTATISTTNCLPDPNLSDNTSSWNTEIVPPGTDPTTAYPAASEVSDQQTGSILFFPIYTSDAVNANSQNARINITNTSPTENVCVHLFAVDGASCAVLDAFICLTPNQTSTFLASDFDPGNTGYLMAVAVECDTGLPRAFNCLIGDEFVKFTSGHQANLGAEAIQSVMMFPGGTDPNVTTTTLRFDGMNYNRLPRVLAADNIQSAGDGNSTLLIINRVGGNFTTTGATIGNITGNLYDDAETGFSFTANLGVCQARQILSNSFPRTFTPFTRAIPAGRSGWMKFWAVEDRALLGAQINFNSTAGSNSGSFNQGHNLHKLTLTDAATITVPVFIPSCSN